MLDVIDRGRAGALLRDRYPKRTKVVLTLTPLGAAGAAAAGAAETRSLTCDVDTLARGGAFTWLPPAPFKVTAKAITPDAKEWSLKLTLSPTPIASDWSGAVDADLESHPAIGITDVPR